MATASIFLLIAGALMGIGVIILLAGFLAFSLTMLDD